MSGRSTPAKGICTCSLMQELIKGVSVANEWYKQRFESSSCSDARTILACVSSALDLIVQVFTFCKVSGRPK